VTGPSRVKALADKHDTSMTKPANAGPQMEHVRAVLQPTPPE
jgi:hypothetical protein